MSHEAPPDDRQRDGESPASGGTAPGSGDPIFEALLDEHRHLWQQGEPIFAAEYLARDPILQADSLRAAALIYQEFVLREQGGESVDLAEYAADFPEYAAELRLLHDADRFVQRLFADAPGDVALGRFLGEFELLEEIGRGGMGIVYRARQKGINRLVALKTLSAGKLASAVNVERFRNEARAVGQLRHRNIVSIHTAGLDDGRHFFTMDLVEGKSLAELVRHGPLSPSRAAAYVRAVALAIHYAHEQGILHRDLKPSNILIDNSDQPRITDFGLARWLAGNSRLTLTGQVLGTPGYMSPEQAAGHCDQIGTASDVYALGAILYELVTGRPTLLADTPMEALLQIVRIEPIPPRLLNPRVPRDLETICLKCLEKEPGRRYASAGDLAGDLERFGDGLPVRARPIGKAGRLCRWCRRNKLLAGLAAVAASSLLAGSCASTYFAVQANRRADEAVRARLDSEYRLYVADMRLAQRAWNENQVPRLRELLDAHRPKDDGDIDRRGFEWYYLDNLCHTARLTLDGFGQEVHGVAYSPDGNLLAACGRDRMRIWDAATGRVLHDLSAPDGAIHCVVFSPDGKRLASGRDSALDIWDAIDGEALMTLPRPAGAVVSIAFSPDGKTLAAAGLAGEAIARDDASGRIARTLLSDTGVESVAYSPDGKRLVAAERDGKITVWDLDGKRRPLTLRGYAPALPRWHSARTVANSPSAARTTPSGSATLPAVRNDSRSRGTPVTSMPSFTARMGGG